MDQLRFAEAEDKHKRRKTWRGLFLEEYPWLVFVP